MLNRVILMGRITHDLELKNILNGISVLAFSVAVDRGYAKQGEERQADFINCVAYKQRAVFINNYFAKGRMIAIEGHLHTRNYDDKNGIKRYVTEVIVDNVSFTGEPTGEPKKDSNSGTEFNPSKEVNQSTNGNNPSKEHIDSIGDINDFEVVISDDGVPF